MTKSKSTITAPSLPAPKQIKIKQLGRLQRILVIDEKTNEPINKIKKGNKTIMENSSNHVYGVIYLIVKIALLIAAITMAKMQWIHFIVDIPMYQIVGGILLIVLIYLELEPYFAKSKKVKKDIKALSNKKPSDFIEI